MKILQSTIRYYPALGGVEEYVKNICEGLVARDHKVDVSYRAKGPPASDQVARVPEEA